VQACCQLCIVTLQTVKVKVKPEYAQIQEHVLRDGRGTS